MSFVAGHRTEAAGFSNEPVAFADLPTLDPAEFEPISPDYYKMRVAALGFVALIVVVITGIAVAVVPSFVPIPRWALIAIGCGVLAPMALMVVVHRLDAQRMGYQIRSHDFSYRRGILWRRVDTMPFARVQHVVIRRDPVQRYFNLATLDLRSAGGSLSVSGLDVDTAERFRLLVIERAGELADEELADEELADEERADDDDAVFG